MGLEPTTTEITTRGSTNWATAAIINIEYIEIAVYYLKTRYYMSGESGAPGRIRTCDHLLRRQMLYPTELQALIVLTNIVVIRTTLLLKHT